MDVGGENQNIVSQSGVVEDVGGQSQQQSVQEQVAQPSATDVSVTKKAEVGQEVREPEEIFEKSEGEGFLSYNRLNLQKDLVLKIGVVLLVVAVVLMVVTLMF